MHVIRGLRIASRLVVQRQAENKRKANDFLRAGWERRAHSHRFVPEGDKSDVNLGMNPYR